MFAGFKSFCPHITNMENNQDDYFEDEVNEVDNVSFNVQPT